MTTSSSSTPANTTAPGPATRSAGENSATLPTTRGAAATLAVAGLGTFALASLVDGLLYPGYDPVREGISALAATNSPSAPLMITGFLALAAGTGAAGVALWRMLRTGVAGRIGAILVLVAGIGMVVVGLARQDCSDFAGACRAAEEAGTLSGHHMLHQLMSLAVFTLLTIALFVLARGLKRSGTWAHLAGWTRLAGLVAFLLVAALVSVGYGDVAGLVQRFFVLLVFGWPVLLAVTPPRR